MKILVLEHLFPLPADSGGKIKSYYAIRALAREHELRVLSYIRGEDERRAVPELRRICPDLDIVPLKRSRLNQIADGVAGLAYGRSFIVSRDFRREMRDAFRRSVDEFAPDVVHIDHLQMAQFVDFSSAYKTVLDNHNVESMIIKRIAETSSSRVMRSYARLEWPKLLKYETEVCRKCDLVLTVSEEDKATLQQLEPSISNVRSVPIGIDTDPGRMVTRDPKSHDILFLGTMHWPPNIDCVLYFHRDILPLVREAIPDCTFTIAGQRPAPSVAALAHDPAVRVTGYVTDTKVPAAKCGVFVVPLRSGSGVRVKILDALAMGLPVVSTSIGAEGLDVKHGEHLLIADTPQDFARAVADVLSDPALAEKLVRSGRELVEAKYSWQVAGDALLSIYAERFGQAESV